VCATVGTASLQHLLCMVYQEQCWKMTKLYWTFLH